MVFMVCHRVTEGLNSIRSIKRFFVCTHSDNINPNLKPDSLRDTCVRSGAKKIHTAQLKNKVCKHYI